MGALSYQKFHQRSRKHFRPITHRVVATLWNDHRAAAWHYPLVVGRQREKVQIIFADYGKSWYLNLAQPWREVWHVKNGIQRGNE
jgi:hypothetical protein